ncbi:MAG: hypothetical protein JXA71_06215, partial [Chitinispirillaceae bacterium]|nr:hypothetical protein [Chitinispirillaceae bacterium]
PGFRLFPHTAAIGRQSDAVFKYRPITFADRPHFSAGFMLVGPDGQQIRELFNIELLTYFEKLKGICVEGFGTELLIYYYRKVVGAADYPRFYGNARSIFQLFLHRSTAGKTG